MKKKSKAKKTVKPRIPFPSNPVEGKKIDALEHIAPLWQYIARYLFALSFAGLPDDEHKRICLAVRAVDDGLISCGYQSGAFNPKDVAEVQAAAEKVMALLPKEL